VADTTQQTTLQGYQAAISGAAVYRVPGAGYLRIAGADRIDFIQRQTTNDIRALTPDHSQITVLTTGTARILDVWRLIIEPDAEGGDDVIGVITLPGRANATISYLRTRIFFMDKVTVTDASAETVQLELFGPTAADVLLYYGISVPEAGQVVEAKIAERAGRVIGLEGLVGRGILLLVAADSVNLVIAALVEAGAVTVDTAAYEVLRVEAGLPGPDHELTEEYTPLEARLDAAVSSTKGCYTGQEIIARQITYDKITKRLVGIKVDAGVEIGATVKVDDRTAGEITSVVESPRFGTITLAVLKRPHFEAGVSVSVIGENERTIQGETVNLPFG
jgi:folate-binding protein YgfZ